MKVGDFVRYHPSPGEDNTVIGFIAGISEPNGVQLALVVYWLDKVKHRKQVYLAELEALTG